MIYAVVAVVLGLIFPHLEYRYLAGYNHSMTVSAATAVFSAAASCMLPLWPFVFALVFVIVPFGSTYSAELVLWLSRDPIVWHVLVSSRRRSYLPWWPWLDGPERFWAGAIFFNMDSHYLTHRQRHGPSLPGPTLDDSPGDRYAEFRRPEGATGH